MDISESASCECGISPQGVSERPRKIELIAMRALTDTTRTTDTYDHDAFGNLIHTFCWLSGCRPILFTLHKPLHYCLALETEDLEEPIGNSSLGRWPWKRDTARSIASTVAATFR